MGALNSIYWSLKFNSPNNTCPKRLGLNADVTAEWPRTVEASRVRSKAVLKNAAPSSVDIGALDLAMTKLRYVLNGSRNGRGSCSHAVAPAGVREAVEDEHDVPAPAVKN